MVKIGGGCDDLLELKWRQDADWNVSWKVSWHLTGAELEVEIVSVSV